MTRFPNGTLADGGALPEVGKRRMGRLGGIRARTQPAHFSTELLAVSMVKTTATLRPLAPPPTSCLDFPLGPSDPPTLHQLKG